MTEKTKFETLYEVNCNKYTEKKNGLTYLSWTYAWKEFKKQYPDAKYEINHWDGKPYLFDNDLGYMCETTITAGGETHSMWLPVMNSVNKAQKNVAYEIKTANGKTIRVEPATMFDINTTIMRCLVKNIAMFGLGLYIYAGEDIPQVEDLADKESEEQKKIQKYKERIGALLLKLPKDIDTTEYKDFENINDLATLTKIGVSLNALVQNCGGENENN